MNRVMDVSAVNGAPVAIKKVVKAKPTKAKPTHKQQSQSMHSKATVKQRSYVWCTAYVVIALVLSAFLNGYANANAVENKIAAWGLGLIIPVLVYTLFKAAGWMHEQGNRPLAIGAAIFGTMLVFLSVADCQQALSVLTHSPTPWLSWAFAITIDCGLVVCELGTMQVFLSRKR